jgi:SAM-dependent methyltransferase
MSATNRIRVLSEPLAPPAGCHYPEGTTLRAVTRTKRRKGDYYETPAWAVDAILPFLPLTTASLVVDAGSGSGAIAECIAKHAPRLEVIGVEKQADLVAQARAKELYSCEFVEADFETWQSERSSPDIIIMNPPYSRAIEFIRRAQQIVKRGGTVAALLRVGFLASAQRYDFHTKHPSRIRVLDKRPSFTGDGKTDASDYAWFVWCTEATDKGTWSVLHVPRPKVTPKKKAKGKKS